MPSGIALAQTAVPADTARFSCFIQSVSDIYAPTTAITFTVSVRNNTSRPQLLAVAVDGSADGMRCPVIEFTVYRVSRHVPRKLIKPDMRLRCGNTDGMAEADFIKLMPGAAFDPCEKSRYANMTRWFPYSHLKPGEYEVYFTYSTQPTNNIGWHGASNSSDLPPVTEKQRRVQALIAQVPAVRLQSNPAHLSIIR